MHDGVCAIHSSMKGIQSCWKLAVQAWVTGHKLAFHCSKGWIGGYKHGYERCRETAENGESGADKVMATSNMHSHSIELISVDSPVHNRFRDVHPSEGCGSIRPQNGIRTSSLTKSPKRNRESALRFGHLRIRDMRC